MRLVDADEAYKVLTDYYHHRTEIQHKALKEALSRVPTVDIDAITESHEEIGYDKGFRDGYAQATSEVRHGHWIGVSQTKFEKLFFYSRVFKCSACGNYLDFDGVNFGRGSANYCPNCGAKMDGVKR